MSKRLIKILLVLILLAAGGVLFYNLPPVHSRLAWRVSEWTARIRYALNPPAEVVFVPQEQGTATGLPAAPTPTPTARPTSPPTHPPDQPTDTPAPTATPTPSPTPIPPKVTLTGVVHEYQHWNNCGPANLAMALSYWKWKGTQEDTAAYLKPNSRDKNVMPYEMANYVTKETNFKVVLRLGGDIDLIKRLVAAGFPTLIEKGFEGTSFEGWMGHYEVVTGYDDSKQVFIVQDSYIAPGENLAVPYEQVISNWRAFDYIYLVIYPPERESDVFSVLGALADEQAAFEHSAQLASDEIASLTGRDQYFAWYNRGTSLVKMADYSAAAQAYDQAFTLYIDIPEAKRPWRMIWYQTGPYYAYYFTGRYKDIVSLATQTLEAASEPVLEESYVWRARAEVMLGERDKAIDDLRTALKYHPGFEAALADLEQMGVTP
jgi:tetratricopeptide (TPR) repeat protein